MLFNQAMTMCGHTRENVPHVRSLCVTKLCDIIAVYYYSYFDTIFPYTTTEVVGLLFYSSY